MKSHIDKKVKLSIVIPIYNSVVIFPELYSRIIATLQQGGTKSGGRSVTIVDSCMEQYGANLNNVKAIKDLIHVNYADIRDRNSIKVLVKILQYIRTMLT